MPLENVSVLSDEEPPAPSPPKRKALGKAKAAAKATAKASPVRSPVKPKAKGKPKKGKSDTPDVKSGMKRPAVKEVIQEGQELLGQMSF